MGRAQARLRQIQPSGLEPLFSCEQAFSRPQHPALAGLAGTESNEQVMSGEERHGVCFSAAQTISPGSEELEHPMIRDLSYGIRTLGRTPGFTLIAVLTIALGIAGNTAIFSAIDEQVLRSLPVPHPEQLVEF